MITIKIDESDLINLFMDRVRYWSQDPKTTYLFEQMYQNYIDSDGGVFDGAEIDITQIVDNDYINNCEVIDNDDPDFDIIKRIYENQGLGDCSCEDLGDRKFSYIEAVDDEQNPTAFLVRY